MNQRPEIITAAIAAFDKNGALDKTANIEYLQRLVPFVDGVLAAGTTAEFPSLSPQERTDLISWSLEVFGPNRTIAQIGAPSTMQALNLLGSASTAGAERFAAITPYYLKASPRGVMEYYKSLRDHIAGKLYAYVFPDVAGTDVSMKTISQLESIGIDGVKLSGKAAERVQDCRQVAPSMCIWSGNDGALPQTMADGGTGTVSGVSGVAPEAWASLRDSLAKADVANEKIAQAQVERLVNLLGPSISRLKYALNYVGVPVGVCRMPIDEPDNKTKQEIARMMSTISLSK